MPKYNIFKIPKNNEEALIENLNNIELELQPSIRNEGYLFRLFVGDYEASPKWLNLYRDFIGEEINFLNKTHFGVLLISNNEICYAISYGKAHFYVRNFCQNDFGISLGQRILNKDNISLTNSKVFGGKRKKAINTYSDNSSLNVESGESILLLKGKTIDNATFGKTATFGESAKFSIGLNPLDLGSLIDHIEEQLPLPQLFEIPLSRKVKDESIKSELDLRLVNAINNGDVLVGMEEQTFSGTSFLFRHEFEIEGVSLGHTRIDLEGNIDISLITQSIEENGKRITADNINRVYLRVLNDEYSFKKPLKYFLDYVDRDNYFLNDGVWHIFNSEYLRYLKQNVDAISWIHKPEFEDAQIRYEQFSRALPNDQKRLWYFEKFFNNNILPNHGFRNIDRELEKFDKFKLEIADSISEDSFIFVKKGTPQKLNYVIDQSLATLQFLMEKGGEIEIEGTLYKPKHFCLLLFLTRVNPLEKMSDINSLIFLMKLNEWRKKVVNQNIIPKIWISYLN